MRRAVLNVVGLSARDLSSGVMPRLAARAAKGSVAKVKPAFPAVTCTAYHALPSPPSSNDTVSTLAFSISPANRAHSSCYRATTDATPVPPASTPRAAW